MLKTGKITEGCFRLLRICLMHCGIASEKVPKLGKHKANFSAILDETLKCETPSWLNDLFIITRASMEKHEEEMAKVLTSTK